MQRAFEDERAREGNHQSDDKLPRRDCHRIGVDPRPFQIDRTGCPAHRRREREDEADQVARSEQRIDKHRQSDGAKQERDAAYPVQPLPEDGISEQGRPDRHRVRENRHSRRCGRKLRESGEEREAGNVKQPATTRCTAATLL